MIVNILLLIILIIINGIFSASELAFLSIDKFELKESIKNGDKKALKIKKLLDNSSQFLSTIQIAITLAGFLASAFAADTFADYFLAKIDVNFISVAAFRSILVVLITIVLSYFTLVFGELVPKKLAINYPSKIAYIFVDLIRGVMFVCYPLIKFLTFSTNIVCKIFNIEDKNDKMTEEDIKKMILLAREEGVVEEKEKEYMFNIFQFNDTEVVNVMTPKDKVILIDINESVKNNIAIIKESKYTRFPVYENDMNNIIGILNVKDLLMQYKGGMLDFKTIIRPVTSFPFNCKIDDVFRYMQKNKESICTVFDGRNFLGIVTLEDAIEEIVGNIYDEYDK